MRGQRNGLASKEIDRPPAVFHMAEKCQPGEPAVMTTVLGVVVMSKDTPHRKVADVETKALINLHRYSAIAVTGIFLFDRNNKFNYFLRGAFAPSAFATFVGIKPLVASDIESMAIITMYNLCRSGILTLHRLMKKRILDWQVDLLDRGAARSANTLST